MICPNQNEILICITERNNCKTNKTYYIFVPPSEMYIKPLNQNRIRKRIELDI